MTEPSNFRGWMAVVTTWGMIAGAFALAGFFPSIWTVLIALLVLGGRHLALAILMHDASHYSLFRTRSWNDSFGRWLCAYPTWQDLRRYRKHHWEHHRWAGSEKDADLSLILPYPTTRASLTRKLFRDISGITGVRRILGLLLMDFGFVQYTVAAEIKPIAGAKERGFWEIARCGFAHLHGMVITNAALFLILWAVQAPWLYLLWVGSWLTTFSLFVRIRSLAEHACTERDLDPLKSTRTTYANPLARITVAPHRVNFHIEHHLLPNAPYFRLPQIHRILKRRNALENAHLAAGYLEVLRLTVRVPEKN